jgi:oligopeptidase B
MHRLLPFLMCALALTAQAAFDLVNPKPPLAAKKPKDVTVHEDKRIDDYFWLREKGSPEVVSYLEKENAYTEAVLAPAKELRAALYQEMVGRIKEDDSSAPVPYLGYEYYTRTEKDRQYPIYCRKKIGAGTEEVLLDLNKMIGKNTYIAVGHYAVSDDGARLAYAIDWTGYRQYEVFVMDLATKQLVPQQIGQVSSLEWGAGHDVLYYGTENDSKRSDKVHRWTLSTGQHELLYEDKDELYNVDVQKSRDDKFLFIHSESKLSSEVLALPTAGHASGAKFQSLLGRTENVKYYAEHRDGRFYFLTNRDGAKNYKVVSAPEAKPSELTEVIPHNPAIKRDSLEMFAKHFVVEERENGLPHLRVYDFATGKSARLEMPEAAYEVSADRNWEFDTTLFRFNYQSLVRPPTVYAANLVTGERTLIKQTEVLGGFDAKNYKSERLWATARDGTKVPLSIVYRADLDRSKPQPLWLYGYGSYGISMPVSFSSSRVSLLDRGLIYVIAHIRGGGELGEEWREAGRMDKKMNTFNDFVDCAQWLVDQKWTTPKQLVTSGGSAGGLLMGAVLNQRPDLFQGAIIQVPFVDVLNTMLDATLPLTTEEYIEWGNPNIKTEYFWMRAYSPYDNLKAAAYPNILVNVSYNDSQVPYWEGAKYLAKLRTLDTGKNATLLHATMGAGHGGAGGRYDALNDTARNYAFFLQSLGLNK